VHVLLWAPAVFLSAHLCEPRSVCVIFCAPRIVWHARCPFVVPVPRDFFRSFLGCFIKFEQNVYRCITPQPPIILVGYAQTAAVVIVLLTASPVYTELSGRYCTSKFRGKCRVCVFVRVNVKCRVCVFFRCACFRRREHATQSAHLGPGAYN